MKPKVLRTKSSRRKEGRHYTKNIEYVLLMTPRYSEQLKQTVTYIALRTVKQFKNFRYDVVVNHRLDDRTLRLDIRGLRAPELTLPGYGPAIFETEYADLSGSYDLIVTKLHKEVNQFRVRVTPEDVVIKKNPSSMFVELVTSIEAW